MPEVPPSAVQVDQNDRGLAWSVMGAEGLRNQRPRFVNNPDVWGVEIGVREEGGGIAALREPCLKVFVYQKGLVTEGHHVEPWTSVYRQGVGRISFRTDIVQLGVPRVQSTTTSPAVLTKSAKGCGTYVLAAAANLYLLTAAHVLAGVDLAATKGTKNVRWRKQGQVGRGRFSGDRRVYWPWWTSSVNQEQGFADVGLAQLDSASDLGPYALPGKVPAASGIVSWDDALLLDEVVIHGSKRDYRARFASRVPSGLLVPNAATGTSVRYWRMLRFLQVGGIVTGDGDSGAPILTPDRRLVGIHVVRSDEGNPARHYSLAICAGDVIEQWKGLLGADLRLHVAAAVN